MKTKLTLLLVTFILIVNGVYAESKAMLRLNLQKGTTYEMTMVTTNNIDQEMMGQKMKMDQKMEMVFSYQVLDVLPNHNFSIDYSLLKINMNMNMNGQEMNFGSEGTDTTNPMNESFKNLCSLKLKLELNPKGQVEQIEGLDEYAKKLYGNPQMAQSMQMFMDDKNFKSFIGQTFSYFPENEVKKGDKWTSSFNLPAFMNVATTMNFEVAEIVKKALTLNVTSDINLDTPIEQAGMNMNMKMTGTQTGTMTIDTNDGWVTASDLNQKFDVKMKMKNPQSGEDMEIPMVMNSDTKITVNKK